VTAGLPWCGREPRRWQPRALDAVLGSFRDGVRSPLVHACTGAGKSLFLAELAARCHGRVLVTTPTQALVTQLSATLRERSPGEVGRCFQHAWEPGKRIVVTCNASLGALLDEQPEWACWVADEAHRVEGDGIRALEERVRRQVAVGLTATPFRGDRRGLETWDRIVFSYTSGEAVRDKVLVPWRAVRWDGTGEPDTDAVVEQWVHEAEGPGIVSATSIDDAEAYAARLGKGVAEAIHQRHPESEREMRIRRLKSGKIRCLVHVQLLAEGVDLPWLCWLAMRRLIASPVRMVQEVGRVLRASPGKTEAVLYDPHDLLGELGLVHAAALEDAQKGEPAAAGTETTWSIPELEGLEGVSRLPPPRAVDAISGWVTDVLGQLRLHEVAAPPSEFEGGKWRRKRASDKQRAALGRMAWAARYFPDEAHRRAVHWVLEQDEVRSGTASDLIDVLRALAKAGKSARSSGERLELPCAIPGITIKEAA
jgi:superfamily II DNA or RNA helicase